MDWSKHFQSNTLTCAAVLAMLGFVGGCTTSSVVPMRGVERVEEWVPAEEVAATAPSTMAAATESAPTTMAARSPASEPTTLASTEPAAIAAETAPASQPTTVAATAPAATQPLVKRVRDIDHDQTSRFVYRASYKRVWEQAEFLLTQMGYRLDRQDYRLGVLTTFARPSADIVEPWRQDIVGFQSSMENTVNRQQRTIRLTVKPVEGKAEFFDIGVQVLVERYSNPSENLGGESFITGSGFGRVPVSLRSDYAPGPQEEPPATQKPLWRILGHDVKLEKKILDQLFEKI